MTNTLRANRLSQGELLSGEPTFGRNDLIPERIRELSPFSLPVPEPVREPASMLLARFSWVSRYLIAIASEHRT